jgi:hypothetical protein
MTTSRQKISPPELAARWGIDPAKVIAWIRAGELRAIDASTHPGGRPRYLIDVADILIFEQRRSATPAPAAPRRRRKPEGVIEFF